MAHVCQLDRGAWWLKCQAGKGTGQTVPLTVVNMGFPHYSFHVNTLKILHRTPLLVTLSGIELEGPVL